MSRLIFKNAEHQKFFEQNGYCLIPLLNKTDITRLEEIYHNNPVEEQPAIEKTARNKDYNLSKRVNELIADIVTGRLSQYLIDYRMLYAGFITKNPGRSNEVGLHQDPVFVDESRFHALNVWSPLTDVNELNGALWVIRKSNNFFQGFRGQPVKEYNYNGIAKAVMDKFGTLVKMKAGEVILYDAALFHFSLQNDTNKARIVCSSLMIPLEAAPVYQYFNKELNTVDVYEIDNDFMLRHFTEQISGGQQIQKKLLNRRPLEKPHLISLEEFEDKYYSYNGRPKDSLWGRLLQAVQRVF